MNSFDTAREILVAALQSGAIKANGAGTAQQAESIGKAFGIILASVRKEAVTKG